MTGGRRTAHIVFAVTAAISLVSIGIEFYYAAFGLNSDSAPEVSTRLIRWFSYFTNASNILCILGLVPLSRNADHDGRGFRPVRLAGLVGITVTFFVYMIALRPTQVLDGIHIWANAGFHIFVPLVTVVSWLVFGPFPRFDARAVRLTLIAVVVWAAWTLAHGAVTGWYPYAIIDASALGYPVALRTSGFILVFIALVTLLYRWVDGVRSRRLSRAKV